MNLRHSDGAQISQTFQSGVLCRRIHHTNVMRNRDTI